MRRILIPVDGSEASNWTILRLREMLRRPGVAARLVTVVECDDERARDVGFRSDIRHLETHASLRALMNELRRDGVAIGGEVLFGDPATEILRETVAGAYDLVAMTTHARTGMERMLFGSVAHKVLRSSPAPLLLFHPLLAEDGSLSPAAPRDPVRFREILVLLDGSPAAEEILPAAQAMAGLFGSRLILFSAAPEGGTAPVARYLKTWRGRMADQGIAADVWVREGPAPERILEAIAAHRPDAVAMTTHGRTGLARLVLGSVAERVMRGSHVPMVLVCSSDVRAETTAAAARVD